MIRALVRAFHYLFGQPVLEKPTVPDDERVRLRLKLITEEYGELLSACGLAEYDEYHEAFNNLNVLINGFNSVDDHVDLVEVADALGDLAYVTEGMNLEFGIDSEAVLNEIHRSNMAKAGGIKREDGKVLKPSSWTPPNIRKVLGL